MIQKLLGQASKYLAGNVAIRLTGFASLPFLTHLLPVDEFGLLNLIGYSMFFLVALSKFGLQHAGVRFYTTYKKNNNLSIFYSTLFWGSLGLAVIIAVILIILARILGHFFDGIYHNWIIYVVAALCVVRVMLIRVTNFFQVEQRLHQYNLVSIVQQYSSVALGIIFLILISRTANWYWFAFLLTGFMTFVAATFLYIDKALLHPKYFSVSFLKEALRYGVPLQFMEMSNWLIKFSDKYLLQIFLGVSAVGIYALGASLAMYIQEIIFMSVNLAVFPLLMELYSRKGLAAAEEFISRVTNYLWICAIPIIFGFSILAKEIVIILASEKFLETASIIPLMITGSVLWGFCQLYAAGLHISKNTKRFTMMLFVGAALNILLNIVLIPKLSIMGAATATLLTFAILLILIIKSAFVYLRVRFYPGKLIKAILASTVMCLLILFIHADTLIIQLILRLLIGSGVYVICILAIDSDLRRLTRKYQQKVLDYIVSLR